MQLSLQYVVYRSAIIARVVSEKWGRGGVGGGSNLGHIAFYIEVKITVTLHLRTLTTTMKQIYFTSRENSKTPTK